MKRDLWRNVLAVVGVVMLVAAVGIYRRQGRDAPAVQGGAVGATKPAGQPRMVDFGSDKCIPCKEMAPILVELRQAYAGKAGIEFVDVWKDPAAGQPFDVRIIPTQIFFDRDGKQVWRHEGFLGKDEIIAKLRELGAG